MSNQENTITFDTLQKLLPLHVRTNQVPFLAGDPGIGKSATVKKLADQFDTKVFVLSVNGISTKEDLTGARMVEDKEAEYGAKQVFFPTAVVQNAVNYANANPDKPVILFLDEINRTTPDVTTAFMSVITERKVGDVKLPDNIRLIAAGNDKGHVATLDSASISRMQVYHVAPDIDTYMKAEPNLNFYIKQLVSRNPELLVKTKSIQRESEEEESDDPFEELSDNDQMSQISVPRTLSYMSDFLNAAGLDGNSVPDNLSDIYNPVDADESPLRYAIQATLGDTETSAKLFDNLVESIEHLTTSPNTAVGTSQVDVPEPNAEILQRLQDGIDTVDEMNEFFDSDNLTIDEFVDTFFTIIQPDSFKTIKYADSVFTYYDKLAQTIADETNEDTSMKLSSKIAKTFNSLLRSSKVAQPVIQHISQQSDNPLSNQLNVLIDVNKA